MKQHFIYNKENIQSFFLDIAVMKDAITKLGGKIPSAVDLNGWFKIVEGI